MPCEECEEGKYKWGEMGECLYETLEDCQLANQETETEEEVISDVAVDFTLNFSKEQMEELHEDGELVMEVKMDEEENGETINILFTYKVEEAEEVEEEYAGLTASMLDDELDDYIDKVVDSIKELHK